MKEFLKEIFTKRTIVFLVVVLATGFIIGWTSIYWMILERGFMF